MLPIDRAAWTNRWRHLPALEKLVFAGGLLGLSLALPPLAAAPVILVVTALATIAGAGVAARDWLAVMAVPAGFLAASAPLLAVAVDWSDGLSIALAPGGPAAALAVVVRSLAAVSCLAFLVLTTPVIDLLALLRRAGLPPAVREVTMLTYRLVFVVLDCAAAGRRAQTARQGYSGLRNSVRSLGWLAAGLLHRALDRGRRLETGLAARAFDGDLRVLEPARPASPARLAAIGAVLLAVAAAAWLLDGLAA
jgi:cobalt/nickel transport system permease protein